VDPGYALFSRRHLSTRLGDRGPGSVVPAMQILWYLGLTMNDRCMHFPLRWPGAASILAPDDITRRQGRATDMYSRWSISLAALLLTGCGADAPEPPPVVEVLQVSIDADNNCSLEKESVDCSQVASVIHGRYPTSRPRVDICLDKQARYEPAMEVMQSVQAAGFTGNFDCAKPAAG